MNNYQQKYLKYKVKYHKLKSQIGGGDLDILKNLNPKYNIVIILGALYNEPHILEYVRTIENTKILCISSSEGLTPDKKGQFGQLVRMSELNGDRKENNNLLLQIDNDFNDHDLWLKIRDTIYESGQTLSKIIVDWSTAKFFNDNYNYSSGNIMGIIKEFIQTQNTEFYSPCCFEISTILGSFKYPMFYPYFYSEKINKYHLRREEEDINQVYISQFQESILEEPIELIYISENNDRMYYPITRRNDGSGPDGPIKRFIIFKNKTN